MPGQRSDFAHEIFDFLSVSCRDAHSLSCFIQQKPVLIFVSLWSPLATVLVYLYVTHMGPEAGVNSKSPPKNV